MIILIVFSFWLLMKEHEIWVSHYKHICIWEKCWRGKAEEEMQPGQCQFRAAKWGRSLLFSGALSSTLCGLFLIKHWWVGLLFCFVLEKYLFFEARRFVAVHWLWWISSGTEISPQGSCKGQVTRGQTSALPARWVTGTRSVTAGACANAWVPGLSLGFNR